MKNYLDLMEKVWTEGEIRTDRTGVGTRSLFGEHLRIDLADGFPLLTTKKVHFRSIAIELMWFLNGRTDNQWLNDRGVTIWDEWATPEQCARFGRRAGNLGPVYGHQWRDFGGVDGDEMRFQRDGVDQIKRVLTDLQANPMSRRHIVTAWNPTEADQVALPPCHTLFQFYVHTDGRLDCHMYQRSADLFLGVPFNIASYALLTHLVAAHCNLQVGSLIVSFGDVHLYLNHKDQVAEQLHRRPRKRPSLLLDGDTYRPIQNWSVDDFEILGYNPDPAIPAPVAA